jgi:hypothetical protein
MPAQVDRRTPLASHAMQMYALMFLPGIAAAVLLAVHVRVVYVLVKRVQGQPNLLMVALWISVDLVLPHLLLHYMHKTTQQHSRATQHAPHRTVAADVVGCDVGTAAGSKAAKLFDSSPTCDGSGSEPAVQAKGSSAEPSHGASMPKDAGGNQTMQIQNTASGQGAELSGQNGDPPGASTHSPGPAAVALSRTAHSGVSSNSSLQTVGRVHIVC